MILGSSPYCACQETFIYIDGVDWYQHEFGKLITVNQKSRTYSLHFDFTILADLRDQLSQDYRRKLEVIDTKKLSKLLDCIFEQNIQSLNAAECYHNQVSVGMTSVDYESPVITKYDRQTPTSSGVPQIETSYSLLHYEKAIIEFNNLKEKMRQNNRDRAFMHGVYCTIAIAACLEAIANKLIYMQTSSHPDHTDRRTPFKKINDAIAVLCDSSQQPYIPFSSGEVGYDTLETIRWDLRNKFMHAKEAPTDVDLQTRSSEMFLAVDEAACRHYLKQLRLTVKRIYSYLPPQTPTIVTETNVKWLGDLEVP